MNRIKSILFVFSIIFSVINLAACMEILPYNGYFDGGEILDDELMSEIRSKYIVEGTTENNNKSSDSSLESELNSVSNTVETTDTAGTTIESTEENPGVAFWTENGEVYHTKNTCGYLKNKSYMTGTIQQAIESGKERLCSSCGK